MLLNNETGGSSGRHGVKGGLGTSSEMSGVSENARGRGSFASSMYSSPSYSSLQIVSSGAPIEALLSVSPTIRPVEIEEAVARDISAHGFVLRYYSIFCTLLLYIFIRMHMTRILFIGLFARTDCLVPGVRGFTDARAV